MLQVAAAIIQNERGEVLVCKRGPGGSCAHLWEFPGGKREAGETDAQCLVREIKEELALEISVGPLFGQASYRYPDKHVALSFYLARIVGGQLSCLVHEQARWVAPRDLVGLHFCPADKDIVEKLRNL